MHEEFTHIPRTAYFSMEIALSNNIPTYSGGLGVLAGDTLRSAADLELPMVAVTLISRAGYFRQEIDAAGRQIEHPAPWEPRQHCTPLAAKVAVSIEGRDVWVGAWLYVLKGHMGSRQPIVLLDTDLDENKPDDRLITHHLYGGDDEYRLKQEVVLGIGGVYVLHALGFRISEYHLNEGHSALLTLALLRRFSYAPEDVRTGESPYDIRAVRSLCNFTTHTPVEAGHDKFPYELVQRILGDYVELPTLKTLAGPDNLNMTRLALNLSEYVNGVAKRHAETSGRMFPGYYVRAITNGVHPFTWASPGFAALYDLHIPGWSHEPEFLMRADLMADEEIWSAHTQAKQTLLREVQRRCGVTLHPDHPIIGFARRMTAYKRADLLFSDMTRLRQIAQKWPLQIVLAGKAHPRDESGKRLIEQLHAHMRELAGEIPMAFVPDYDMDLALTLVSGVDVWLNTPLRPQEASGTSGMKAALNGVPSLSILDGWWAEACLEGVNGWAIGSLTDTSDITDADALYRKLDETVLPLYHKDRPGWIRIMKGAITKSASIFNSHRMMRRYAAEAYLR